MEELDKVDISETWLWKRHSRAFEKLLIDHTTKVNIIWATDSYADSGDGYGFYDHIKPEKIVGEHGLTIRPRAVKNRDEQVKRVKDKAEVFTPSWVCNAQNNLIDEAWFGKEIVDKRGGIFNRELVDENGRHYWEPILEPIPFPEGKTWKNYIEDMRLEITCGEAPYLVSRYDAVTGEPIDDLKRRIGLLDRKLRVIDENTTTKEEWTDAMRTALESTYGYEWQGDSLLLAREAVLFTVLDYYQAKFHKMLHPKTIESIAYIISWNLWQMDGLKNAIPGTLELYKEAPSLNFDLEPVSASDGTIKEDPGIDEAEAMERKVHEIWKTSDHLKYCLIRDWKTFRLGKGKDKKDLSDVQFSSLLH